MGQLERRPGGLGGFGRRQNSLVMRRGPVHRGRVAHGLFGFGDPFAQVRDLTLQPVDQLPLRRDGRVEILNRLVLMDHTHFKLIEAGGVC